MGKKKQKDMKMKNLACNNTNCIKHLECKRFKLFELGANDVQKNSGDEKRECLKFLPLVSK